MTEMIPNVLAERYGTEGMKAWWTREARVKVERTFWLAVLRAQEKAGMEVESGAIEGYERVRDVVDMGSIDRRERELRHDVKARIEEFCSLSGYEEVHKGMTSRDLTENVEQLQVYISLHYLRKKVVLGLMKMVDRVEEWKGVVLTGRTHNVAAQLVTVGRRVANFGEELLRGLERLDGLIESYPFRGMKGAVGTQGDMLQLFGGDEEKVVGIEERILEYLGAKRMYVNVGQVYPRSLDYEVVSVLMGVGSGIGSFATTLRLMAGEGLAMEGFGKGQVGSSAMPHKRNARSCERISGFMTLMRGYSAMAGDMAGGQWNEGDVSCSVVRRVMLPDVLFTMDGMLETFITVLDQMELDEGAIGREVEEQLPFLLTGVVMMEAVSRGVGREEAHGVIKEHAVAAAKGIGTGEVEGNDLMERLAGDERLGLSREVLEGLLGEGRKKVGRAEAQVESFIRACQPWFEKFPEAREYEVESII